MSSNSRSGRTAAGDGGSRKLSEDRFRLVVEASPNAIIVTNVRGQIELVNKEAEKLFRYTREQLLGQQIEMLIPQRFRLNHPTLREHFMTQPSTRAMGAERDLYAHTSDGQEIPIEIGLNPIHTEDGMLVLSSIIDISERKAAEERFREQTQQIAAASRYKSEFLANMSHELRTPLNSILILSEQLKANPLGNLTQKQVTHADIIHRSGSDLLALINDILDLSKIEAGRMTVVMETIALRDFCEGMERSFRPMAEAKQLQFDVTLDASAPASFCSDYQRIFQIVRNLFSNALKFTSEGRIGIRVFGQGAGDDGRIGIAVTDTGIGIPDDKHEVVFDAFRQVDGSTSRRFGGTGLGLSISRSLAQLLGGEILLESQPGEGSTFTLWLPAGPAVGEASSASRPEEAPAGAQVLVVEDNPVEARHYAGLIRELGYRVTVTGNAQAAIDCCRQGHFSCIVVDMLLPDRSGMELIASLREEQLAGGANLILNTARSLSEADLQRLRQWRVLVLSKSADDEHRLLEAVRLQLTAPALAAAAVELLTELAPETPHFPGKRLLLVDDDVRNIYAMSSLLENLGFDIEVALNGQQALEVVDKHAPVDLILMDMMMPVLDGYQATMALKKMQQAVPVIAVTAHAMRGDREKCLAAGADDYLPKPVARDDLVRMLQKWLTQERGRP